MSTLNICFHGEIRKMYFGNTPLSGAMRHKSLKNPFFAVLEAEFIPQSDCPASIHP